MRMLPRSRTSALRAATRANAAAKAAAKEAQKEKGQRCVCSSSRILLLFLLEHSHRGVGETGRRGVPFSSSASTSSSSSSSSSSSFPKKTTLKKRTKKNFGEYYYRRRRRHHHCGNTTTTTNRATAESAAVFALERRLFFTRATPPLSTPGWWSPTLRFAGKNDDDDDDDGFDGRIDAKDDEYDADARDDDDDDDDFNNNNNNNNDDGGENTDPIVDESFTTADFGYKRHYQVGRDILNTGEPLAASVTTITSAATSSFANAIYRLDVTTGACRGAGTCGRVNVILIGQDGLTYPFDLEYAAGDVPAFTRGSTLPFRVAVAAHLGPIRRVRVRLFPEDTSTGRGWFLEDIGVKCEKTNESYKFTCRDWFGPSDADDTVSPYNRDLEVTTVKDDFEVALEREQRMKVRREMGDFVFDVGAATIPHQDKIKEGARAKMSKSFGYGGEDAYFVETKSNSKSNNNNNNNNNNDDDDKSARSTELSLGVADGVYMWRWKGVDAGLYSRALLREAAKTFLSSSRIGGSKSDASAVSSSDRASPSEDLMSTSDPSYMLERAFQAVTEKNLKGSTTCVLLTLDPRLGVLNAANIGDSGYLVARLHSGASLLSSLNGNDCVKPERYIAYRSPPQEHDFGRPFQLGHHKATDKPSDAMLSTFFLEDDDVIVVGTDGLWDNVSEKEILAVIENRIKSNSASSSSSSSLSLDSNQTFMNNKKEVDACAKEIIQKAFEHANDRTRTTPYSLAATEHFDMVYSGGKKDDITVLVCKIKNRYQR